MPSSTALLGSLALLGSALGTPIEQRQSGWPNPESCTGNCSAIHDPSVVHDGSGTWWRFNTNGGIGIASAPDITGPWAYQGAIMPGGSKISVDPDQGIWAPDVSLIDGTYYAYYAVSTVGSQNSDIGLATATDPTGGSWTDHGSIGLPANSDWNKIDPNFFQQTPSDPVYFSFGSAWDGAYQTQLSSDFMTWDSGAAVANVAHNGTSSPAIIEGSFQFWWPVGGTDYYYLFFSSGACCNTPPNLPPPGGEYKVMVCRGTSPTGPFADQAGNDCASANGGTVVLGSHDNVYAPGGQGLWSDSSLPMPILYYHYVNPTIGYDGGDFQFGFNYVNFSSGWPVVTTAS